MKTYIGIDWSSTHDDVCILNEKEEVVNKFRFDVTKQGFKKLIDAIENIHSAKEEIFIGIETDKNILADYLLALGYQVYGLNPFCVNRFKDRYSVSSKKDDNFDAYNIALILFKDFNRFTPIIKSSNNCEALKMHGKTLEMLLQEKTRFENRLKNDLHQYFPIFTDFFDGFTSVPLNLLKVLNKPEQIINATFEDYLELIKDVKYMTKKRKSEFYCLLKDQTISPNKTIQECYSLRVLIIVDQLLFLMKSIKQVEEKILMLYAANEYSTIFSSLPGAADRLAPRLLMHFGDVQKRFESYQTVQCYAGTCPVTIQSGKYLHVIKMRRGCNKSFRDTLYQFSFCSLSLEAWTREYYDLLRKKGCNHSSAIRALSNKWVKIIFRMWKDKTVYDKEIFLKKRKIA